MQRSRLRRRVPVPSISTAKSQSKDYEFVEGMNTNISNDDMKTGQWRYVSDARQIQIGKWQTRFGSTWFCTPPGESTTYILTANTGQSFYTFGPLLQWAQSFTATTAGRFSWGLANIANLSGSATGTVVLSLRADNAGLPGTELVRTTVAASSVPSGFGTGFSGNHNIQCPDITAGTTYWLVGSVQTGGTGGYTVTATTAGTGGMTSSDGGLTWSAQTYAFNIAAYVATAKPVKGLIRVKRPNGATISLMAHDTTLWSINETTKGLSSVEASLDTAANYVRFAFVGDAFYYVQGTSKPRKYDPAAGTVVQLTSAPENASCIIEHKGLLFFISADDPSKVFYTNFGLFTTFTSTDFFYVGGTKSADPAVALAKVGGNLHIITRNNKYTLYGSENASFRLDPAVGQKGTFSQESVAYDQDNIWLASDDGIYRFNGAAEENIARDVLDWWTGLTNKTNTVLELQNNRLFVFYTPNGQANNSACRVFNILYNQWESEDLNTCVGKTYSRFDPDNYFLQGSNRIGMVMLGEVPSNDYNQLGEPLSMELRTHYNHFGSPGQLKRATFYRPHFDAVTGSYAVQAGYALDYSDQPNWYDIAVTSSNAKFNSGLTFNSGVTFGGAQQINPMDSAPVIGGEWRRLQIRYKHYAAREPVSFDGHVLALETQRLI